MNENNKTQSTVTDTNKVNTFYCIYLTDKDEYVSKMSMIACIPNQERCDKSYLFCVHLKCFSKPNATTSMRWVTRHFKSTLNMCYRKSY